MQLDRKRCVNGGLEFHLLKGAVKSPQRIMRGIVEATHSPWLAHKSQHRRQRQGILLLRLLGDWFSLLSWWLCLHLMAGLSASWSPAIRTGNLVTVIRIELFTIKKGLVSFLISKTNSFVGRFDSNSFTKKMQHSLWCFKNVLWLLLRTVGSI